jgi:hypothetical protein
MHAMPLWILRPVDDHPHWEPWYDKAFGFVVRADSEAEARQIAQSNGGDELGWDIKRDCWTDPTAATCIKLSVEGPSGVVMRDFHAA